MRREEAMRLSSLETSTAAISSAPPGCCRVSARAEPATIRVVSQKPTLFGTDGIRGVAGEYPLDHAMVWRVGCALGRVLRESAGGQPVRVVLGRDTRESGEWLASLVARGLAATGVEVSDVGIITTPGIAFLARQPRFAAGVVISASHNPYRDNGVKILSTAGTKLPEAVELKVEEELDKIEMPSPAIFSIAGRQPELTQDYLAFLEGLAGTRAATCVRRVVMDCANGAASELAPELMRRIGIEPILMNAVPDGRNINLNCGSLHPEAMAEATRAAGADLGVAFDGDADRAIFASGMGRVVDGDHVLYAAAQFMADRDELRGGAVVGTLMTNYALERALAGRGIVLKRASVGDRYVLEEMLRSGANLGGEPSGHIILADQSLAGDGLITLLEMLRVITETGHSLDELVRAYAPLPQLIVNVPVRTKTPLDSIPPVAEAIESCRRQIDGNGRVVVRYSGTELLARVMVEAEDAGAVRRHAQSIASAIKNAIGGANGDVPPGPNPAQRHSVPE
jgi:phosphoglucosamine mutase